MRLKISSLNTIAFLDTHVCINNPYWQSSRVTFCVYHISEIILYSYLRYTNRLLNMFFLLFVVILSELHEKLRRKDWLIEKSTWLDLSERYHFMAARPISCHFLLFFVYSPPVIYCNFSIAATPVSTALHRNAKPSTEIKFHSQFHFITFNF